MSNIAVVGSGLVGRLLALLLIQQNKTVVSNVSLFEKNALLTPESTGLIAAAMVSPVAESVTASEHITVMGQRSLALWPKLLSCLAIKQAWWQLGTIVVAHRQDMSNLTHFQQRLKSNNEADSAEMNADDLIALEPELAQQFNQGLFLPSEGHVDNQALYRQSAQQIQESDINLFEHTATRIIDNTIHLPSGEKQVFDWVIDCRGLGASQQLIDPKATLRGVRGEVVRVRAPQVKLLHPIRVMHPRYPLYIVPKGNNEYVIGATEIESDSEQAISVRSVLELLSAAYSVHSGFAEAEVLAMQTGLRPTLLDNEPSITVLNKSIQINGLYRHGYLLTPYILEQVLQLLRSFDSFCADQWQVYSEISSEFSIDDVVTDSGFDHKLITVFNGGNEYAHNDQ
ncbi:FAD-dependent oxidoreductase [Thalassotalea profundi]|uniref:D-amino-acid oxidase n=1 Tax=Thalassotalea profundi TaxID=2036687 RepID=A0ABQ3IY94_9GAMM|nr:FAD-dependent oxidoreductase [Thalassotalea profundi]GHE97575.1 cytochrome c biogenesis protein CcdA [Thalassotalea profundi]